MACEEIRHGALHNEFAVDMIQGGTGTSTNMNANEAIAHRGLEIMGHAKGDYEYLHPVNDVKMGQSTNDVYPTALNVATHAAMGDLRDAMQLLQEAFSDEANEFRDVLKMGRTQLQDAAPMTLGQEFTTFAIMLDEDVERLAEARALTREVNLGGTAIGTGINIDERYSVLAILELARITGVEFTPAFNLIEATQDVESFVQVSSVPKRIAIKPSKTSNDLRLLSSGPRSGFGGINLSPRQAGSSVMPGKVNPVIPEVVNQIAFEVIGDDGQVTAKYRRELTNGEKTEVSNRSSRGHANEQAGHLFHRTMSKVPSGAYSLRSVDDRRGTSPVTDPRGRARRASRIRVDTQW
jgi:aspartate ammonia-lyase